MKHTRNMQQIHPFLNRALWLVLLISLSACGDSDLPEDYVAVAPRILALRITEPEVSPGDTVSMRLLVGGATVDQHSDMTVTWAVGWPENGVYLEGEAPYNTDYQVTIPPGILDALGEDAVDVNVTASVTVSGKTLSALKRMRICEHPVGRNPEITGVTANFLAEGVHETLALSDGDTLTVDSSGKTAAFTALTETLEDQANDTLIYSWYVSTSSVGPGNLYVYDDKDAIEALLGPGAMAAEFRPSVLYSLFGEDADGAWQKGQYNVYLVVRDNAGASSGAAEDRLGTDFFCFTLVLP